jgi:hypothetical protein
MYRSCGVEYGSENCEFMVVCLAGFHLWPSGLIAKEISKLGITDRLWNNKKKFYPVDSTLGCKFLKLRVDGFVFSFTLPPSCFIYISTDFFHCFTTPQVGQGLLTVEAWRSHSDTSHSVGLLWTSDHPYAETSTWRDTTATRKRHPCPRWDSNPQSQHASGRRAATWTARPLGSGRQRVHSGNTRQSLKSLENV